MPEPKTSFPPPMIKKHKTEDDEESVLDSATELLNSLKLKVLTGLIAGLMTLYSFFGSIYKIPSTLDSHEQSISKLQATADSNKKRLEEIEKATAVTTANLNASITALQGRVDDLAKAQAIISSQISEINKTTVEINVGLRYIKESMDELKKK